MRHWKIITLLASISIGCLTMEPAIHANEEEGTPEGVEALHRTVEELKERISDLEADMSGPDRTTEEPANENPSASSSEEKSRLAAMINEHVEFGGAIEVETFWNRDFDKDTTTDISLEAAELDFEIQVTDWDTGVLAIEFDPEDDKVTVKEAFVTFGDIERCLPFLQIGRLFVPFGISTGAIVGDTLTISDPLTIEVFEAREDVILIGYEKKGFHTSAYVFNGDTNKGGGNDHIEHYGATIRYGAEGCYTSYAVGIDFINSVFDSDALTEEFPEALTERYAPGIAFHFDYHWHGFSIVGEYNGALRRVKFEKDGDTLHLAPKAWQVQLAYETKICCKDTFFSLLYSGSDHLHGAFPKSRYLANAGIWLYDSILLGLEYGHDVDYSETSGGTGRSADFVFTQLAYEW